MTTEVKERQILFSGPMVRAILDGRKTQTRRLVKLPNRLDFYKSVDQHATNPAKWWFKDVVGSERPIANCFVECPHGQPGDRLWVKETFTLDFLGPRNAVVYRADEPKANCKWKPSIFMRRTQSRLTLEIVRVRVERVRQISEEDAKAEGAPEPTGRIGCYPAPWATSKPGPTTYRQTFEKLWESINGKGSWAANPWVWVIEFKRIKP